MKKSRTVRLPSPSKLMAAPQGVAWRRVEKVRRIGMQVVALGTEVVVHHVEQHHQPALVGCVDQALQVLRTAIGGVRRERQHAVIAPVAPPRKIGHRHQLERRDAEAGQVVEALDHAGEIAARSESCRRAARRSLPLPRAGHANSSSGQSNASGSTTSDAPMHVIGIEARDRVWHQQARIWPILQAGTGSGCRGRPSGSVSSNQPGIRAPHGQFACVVQAQGHRPDTGRPEAEADAAAFQRFGAEGHRIAPPHDRLR